MQFALEAGLIPVLYVCFCEVLRKKPSEYFLIIYAGLGFISNSYFGGIGHIFSLEISMCSSLIGVLMAFILFLPYRKFYPQQWALFYYLATMSIWLPFTLFLQFYFYTALVCALLSIFLMIKNNRVIGSSMSILNYWKTTKKPEGNSGIYAPYYIASLFGYLGVYLLTEVSK